MLRIRWVADHLAVVPRRAVLLVEKVPRRAGIIAPIETVCGWLRVHHRVHDVRTRFANAHADAANVPSGKPILELRPGMAGIDRLVDAALGPCRKKAILTSLAHLRGGVEDVGAGRI